MLISPSKVLLKLLVFVHWDFLSFVVRVLSLNMYTIFQDRSPQASVLMFARSIVLRTHRLLRASIYCQVYPNQRAHGSGRIFLPKSLDEV